MEASGFIRECGASAAAVAAFIRDTREDLGLTQYELAERLGSQQAAVARWEKGQHDITMKTLSRIANALDVEFVVRFGGRR